MRLRYFLLLAGFTASQAFPADGPNRAATIAEVGKNCPGEPPGNLASIDCSFSESSRIEQFVAGSLTDQAILGATFFGFVAQLRKDPAEWKRDGAGFGYRVGTRYAQNLAKGLTEYGFGAAMRVDPRHISYAGDPRIGKHNPGVRPRIGHAFMDWLTVRRSSPNGAGKPLPNLPLLAGAASSGFAGYAWYPDRLATPKEAALRASSSLGTALAASFYNEFQPEVSRLLSTIFKRRTPAKTAGAKK